MDGLSTLGTEIPARMTCRAAAAEPPVKRFPFLLAATNAGCH